MKRGFSLLEIIVVISIAGILTSIIVSSFRTSQLRKQQDGIAEGIVAHLEKQRSDTQAGKGGSSYGVRFASSTYTLFTGTSYSPSATSNINVDIDASFSLTDTISNSNNSIYFSKLTGSANETATVTVSHISDAINPLYVTIDEIGTISVVK